MPEFYSFVVFQPNRDPNCVQYIQLLRTKKHMKCVSHPKGGGRVQYIYLSAARLHRQYFAVEQDDDISQGFSGAPSGRGLFSSPTGRYATQRQQYDDAPTPFVVLYNHGNAEDLGGCYQTLKWLSFSANIDIIGYDYRGYGFSGLHNMPASQFMPTEESVCEDADLMYKHVLSLGYQPSQVIIAGRSVGGGPACYLAKQHHSEIAALILESTFESCLSVISSALPLLRCLDMFENKRRIQHVTGCPILLTHGDADHVVPHRCSVGLLSTVLAVRRKALGKALRAYEKRQRERGHPAPSSSFPHSTTTDKAGRHHGSATTGHGPLSSSPIVPLNTHGGGTATAMASATAPTSAEDEDSHEHHHRDSNVHGATATASSTENSATAYATALAEAGLRNYAAGSAYAITPEEKDLGIFHQWMPGCGHNDVELLQGELYVHTLARFLRFVAATSPVQGGAVEEEGAMSEL